jgi:branched-chain amino acid aminotransferase
VTDTTGGVVMVDGVITAAEQARISVLDRGFLYGDAAFEVMRTYGGVPFGEAAHLQRLLASCALLRIPFDGGSERLSGALHATLAARNAPESYLRLVVTRGVGPMGIDPAEARSPSLLVYALPLAPPPATLYTQGVSVGLARARRPTDGTAAAGAKTSNYLASVLAVADARAAGHHEAVLVDSEDRVVEGATSNLFARIDGELRTPPAEAGILLGITRQVVLELARALGIACREAPIAVADLERADEVFITSSIRELVPVVRVEASVVGSGAPGPVALRLLAAYRERVRRETGAQ